jgi:hypothetical protein
MYLKVMSFIFEFKNTAIFNAFVIKPSIENTGTGMYCISKYNEIFVLLIEIFLTSRENIFFFG